MLSKLSFDWKTDMFVNGFLDPTKQDTAISATAVSMFYQIDGHYSVTKSFSRTAVLRGSRGSLISH